MWFSFVKKTWIWASLLGVLAFWGFLIIEVGRRQGVNHIGYDIRYLIPLFAVGTLLPSLVMVRRRQMSWGPSLLLGACLLSIVAIYIFHRFHILIDYDTWIKRGMQNSLWR